MRADCYRPGAHGVQQPRVREGGPGVREASQLAVQDAEVAVSRMVVVAAAALRCRSRQCNGVQPPVCRMVDAVNQCSLFSTIYI